MNTFKQTDLEAEERREKKGCIALLLLVMIAWVVVFIAWKAIICPPQYNLIAGELFPDVGNAIEGHLPKMTEAEIRAQMQKEADRSLFSFKINSRPIFKNGTDAGTLNIENPNHNLYPFVIEIFLSESGEKIYDSGGVLPNHHISRARLAKVLPKGEHPATAYINVYDPQTNKHSGKSAVALTIIVNN